MILQDMKHLCLTLDCYAIEWIGDGKIFVGTQDGRLCVTHLESDSASSVKSIDFKFICGMCRIVLFQFRGILLLDEINIRDVII